MNPYIVDILSQPDALRRAVQNFEAGLLTGLTRQLDLGEFDRIVITGMGASLNAAYPAYLALSALPIPVLFVNGAELVHYCANLVGPRTLLWINSQSGRSAELLHLIEALQVSPPAFLLTFVNDVESPLAVKADLCLSIYAGTETTVSTKTYVNTLAVNLLAAEVLAGNEPVTLKKELQVASDAMEVYLKHWEDHKETLNRLLGEFETLFVLGRGSSMSTVWNGALINKEAAKFALEGMNAADFRHGPLELVTGDFAAMVIAGAEGTASLNRNLALEIVRYGGRAFWLASEPDETLATLPLPATSERTQPLAEIIPLQLLTLVMAERNDVEVGQFRYINKITTSE
jgi:glucosamine--fructose-6-phosphate aminotransferase (isomerizing)